MPRLFDILGRMGSGGWLTGRRLRAQGLVLALALWSIYAWVIATPGLRDRYGNLKGTDFLHFYTLGSLALEHRGDALYDINAQAALASERVRAAAGIRYLPLYPPQMSMFFAPFAHFSYPIALALWWIVSVLIYAACCYCVCRVCSSLGNYGGTVTILAAALPAFFNLIAWGQTSALALACFTVAFVCFRKQQEFVAGISLGLLAFKPQLALAGAILFFSLGAWRVIAGALLSAAAEIGAGVMYYGLVPLFTWFRMIWHARQMGYELEPRPYQTHSLRTFWSMLIPWHSISLAFYVISAIIVLAWTIQVWRRSQSLELRFSILLLATVLVSPHLTVYDLVILSPAMLLLGNWLMSQRERCRSKMGALLYLVYMLPLVGFLSRWTHVQLSVLAMTLLVYQIWKAAGSGEITNGAIPTTAIVARV